MSSNKEKRVEKQEVKKKKHEEALHSQSLDGANALKEFKEVSGFIMEQKASVLDLFEKEDTLDIARLQEAHRKYRTVVALEDAFIKKITHGQQAENKLKSL